MKLISGLFVLALFSSTLALSFTTYNMLYHFDDLQVDQFRYLEKTDLDFSLRLKNTIKTINEIKADVMCIVEWNGNDTQDNFIPTKEYINQRVQLKELEDAFNNDGCKKAFVDQFDTFFKENIPFKNALQNSIVYKAIRSSNSDIFQKDWLKSFMQKSGSKNILNRDGISAFFGKEHQVFTDKNKLREAGGKIILQAIVDDTDLKAILAKAIFSDIVEMEGWERIFTFEAIKTALTTNFPNVKFIKQTESQSSEHISQINHYLLKQEELAAKKKKAADNKLEIKNYPYLELSNLTTSLYAYKMKTRFFQKATGRAIKEGKVDPNFLLVSPPDYKSSSPVQSILLAYNTDEFFEKPESPAEIYGIQKGDGLEAQGFVVAQLYLKKNDKHKIYVICTHFKSKDDGFESRQKLGFQIASYIRLVREREADADFILMGDLNAEIEEIANALASKITRNSFAGANGNYKLRNPQSEMFTFKPNSFNEKLLADEDNSTKNSNILKLIIDGDNKLKEKNLLEWVELGSFITERKIRTKEIDFNKNEGYKSHIKRFLTKMISGKFKGTTCEDFRTKYLSGDKTISEAEAKLAEEEENRQAENNPVVEPVERGCLGGCLPNLGTRIKGLFTTKHNPIEYSSKISSIYERINAEYIKNQDARAESDKNAAFAEKKAPEVPEVKKNKKEEMKKEIVPNAGRNRFASGPTDLLVDILACLREPENNTISAQELSSILGSLFEEEKIDFILASFKNSISNIKVKSVAEYEKFLEMGIPNKQYPSDHFPIRAEFDWAPKDKKLEIKKAMLAV